MILRTVRSRIESEWRKTSNLLLFRCLTLPCRPHAGASWRCARSFANRRVRFELKDQLVGVNCRDRGRREPRTRLLHCEHIERDGES